MVKAVGRAIALDSECGMNGRSVPLRMTCQDGWKASQLYVKGAGMIDCVEVSRSSKLRVYSFLTPELGTQPG